MKQSTIRVYHGSVDIVENPELRPVTRPLDFGVGFYVTTLQKQAEHWAQSKSKKAKKPPIVNVYDLNLSDLKRLLSTKEFRGTSDSWLDFVLKHRKDSAYIRLPGKKILLNANSNLHHTFDAVSGEVADDDVFDSISLYETGAISKEELRRRVRIKRKNDQICFCTQDALAYLKFIEYYKG